MPKFWATIVNSVTAAFTIFQPDFGTSPTADSTADTITFGSSDHSVFIGGSASTDYMDFRLSGLTTIFDNGNSGSTFTVNWANGPHQKLTISAATLSLFFTNTLTPLTTYNALLELQQDTSGSRVIIWQGNTIIRFPGLVLPVLSTGATNIDLMGWFYDGSAYRSRGIQFNI